MTIEESTNTDAAGDQAPRQRMLASERQAMIVDAAVELFASLGFRSGGVIPLAEKVGISHSGVLFHFGSKEKLLLEVVASRERAEAEVMLGYDWSLSGMAGLEELRAFAYAQFDDPLHMRLYHVLIAESLDDGDPLQTFFRERNERIRLEIEETVQRGIDSGEFRSDVDAFTVASALLALWVGVERQWLLDPERTDHAAIYGLQLEMMRAYLVNPSPESDSFGPSDDSS